MKCNESQSCPGIGGAPTRATILPEAAAERKQYPIASGLLDYFPDALAVVANVSYVGNEQHNKGQPLHWARTKSGDEADTMIRHFLQRGLRDKDGIRHTAKMVWRALALLQKELEAEKAAGLDPDSREFQAIVSDYLDAEHKKAMGTSGNPAWVPVPMSKNHPAI